MTNLGKKAEQQKNKERLILKIEIQNTHMVKKLAENFKLN